MTEQTSGYAVFLYEQALEALGEAIKPHVQDGPGGPHVLCQEVDTGGAFVELTLRSVNERGEDTDTELMIPGQMVRLIVSVRSDAAFGFAGPDREIKLATLPVVGPGAPRATERSAAMPHAEETAETTPKAADDRRLPPEG